MRYFVFAILLIGAHGSANVKSLTETRLALHREKNPEKRFYLQSQMVQHYASISMFRLSAKHGSYWAQLILKQAENFKGNWNYGNAIHHAHLVLGRVSLFEGDISEAKRQLKLAAQTPGSPQLDSFGPNMTLAKELLEKGETAAVLEYFDDCSRFWAKEFAEPAIKEWKTDIAKGKIPDFRGNLIY